MDDGPVYAKVLRKTPHRVGAGVQKLTEAWIALSKSSDWAVRRLHTSSMFRTEKKLQRSKF